MFKIAALAVAVTVAAPGFSATIEERDVDRLGKALGSGTERQRDRQALNALVDQAWIAGEALERGIVVTDAEAEAAFEEQRKDTYPRRKDYERYLRESGLTDKWVRDSVRTDLLTERIRAQVTEPAAKSVTPEQVKAYVDANPITYPATRTVRYTHGKSVADAKRIHRRLKRGATFRQVGGETDTFSRGQHPIGHRFFRAPLNKVMRHGRWVFEVTKETPARQMPRAQHEALAWEQLAGEAQRTALDAFIAQFTAKWRARTGCAPAFAWFEDCGQPTSGQ